MQILIMIDVNFCIFIVCVTTYCHEVLILVLTRLLVV
jgi:hypothetical protein